MEEYKLFTPAKVGSAVIENRIVMSPMTRCRTFGLPFINNPDLVDRFKKNWTLSQDLHLDLFYTADEKGYTDYPLF